MDFIKADPDERLRQVLKHGDCTICLIRDHDTDAHMARAAGKPDKLQTCGLYDKASGTNCSSIQNASFHGSATHNQNTQRNFHTRAFPQDARSLRDTGKASMKGGWEKSAEQTRAEEIKEAMKRLKEAEGDGERVLLLVQEVTAVAGQNQMQHRSSIFYEKGSTCSMITKDLVVIEKNNYCEILHAH